MPQTAHGGGQAGGIGVIRVVQPGGRANGLAHGQPAPGRGEIKLMTLVGEAGMAVQRPRHRRDQFFAASHHAAIVAVGFVELKLGELRVVLEADAFVAKVAADLIDALVATDEQAFEVQLEGD